MDDDEYLNIIRAMISHETTLRNNRLTWMWAFQGFLFAAYGVLSDKSFNAVTVITITGFVSSLSICYGLYICSKEIKILKEDGESRRKKEKDPPVIGYYAPVRFFLPWNLLPVLFAIVWVILFLISYFAR